MFRRPLDFTTAVFVVLVSLVAQNRIEGQAISASGTLVGKVICSDSQTPCRFASITIQSVSSATERGGKASNATASYSGATDLEGSYSITGIASGDYYVLGRLAGYLSSYDLLAAEYDGGPVLPKETLDAALPMIHIEANQTTRLNLTLSRAASLSGVVRYDDGAVAIGVSVRLWRKARGGEWKPYNNGSGDQELAPLGFAMHTDDEGRYYAPGMPPGTYIVEANLPESSITPETITGRQSLHIFITNGNALRVFSGDKYRLRQAVSCELHEGESFTNTDITIPTVGLRSLRGSVTAKTDGRTLGEAEVRLLDPETKQLLRETQSERDGSFVFNYVTPGDYEVQVEARPASGKGGSVYAVLTAPLNVSGDVVDLAYALVSSKE